MQMSVFVQNCQAPKMEILTFFNITFQPIEIEIRSASQNDRLNLSFVKDKHAYGKKMARKGPTSVVYQYLSFPIRVYLCHLMKVAQTLEILTIKSSSICLILFQTQMYMNFFSIIKKVISKQYKIIAIWTSCSIGMRVSL